MKAAQDARANSSRPADHFVKGDRVKVSMEHLKLPIHSLDGAKKLRSTGSIILSILDLLTSKGEKSVYTFLKHKQPLGFLCGLLGVLIALPACGVLHRQRPITRPAWSA